MGQRMLYLDTVGFNAGSDEQKVTVSMPGNSALTLPGPYVVFIMVDGAPGIGQFISVLPNSTAASIVPADEAGAARSSPLQPAGTVDLTTNSGVFCHQPWPSLHLRLDDKLLPGQVKRHMTSSASTTEVDGSQPSDDSTATTSLTQYSHAKRTHQTHPRD